MENEINTLPCKLNILQYTLAIYALNVVPCGFNINGFLGRHEPKVKYTQIRQYFPNVASGVIFVLIANFHCTTRVSTKFKSFLTFG